MCLQGARNTVPSLVNRFIIQPLPGKDFLFPRAEAPWKGWTGQGDRRPHLHLRARKRVLRVRGRVQGHTAVMAVALQPDVSAPSLSLLATLCPIRRAAGNTFGEGNGTPLQYSCLDSPMDGGAWWAAVHGVARSRTRLSDFTFTFHFHALVKEMATHSSVLAWRISGTGEPGGCRLWGHTESDTTEVT